MDAEDAGVEDDAAAGLLQLTEADDVRLQPRDEVDAGEGAVLSILAVEDDGAAALDSHHRSVTETDGSMDVDVELGEDAPLPGHVVRGPSIQNPSVGIRICVRAKLGEDALLVEVNASA